MASLDALRLQLTRKLTAAANGTAREWEARLKREGPSDTGEMSRATSSRVSGRGGSILIDTKVDTPYAHIVARGQRPHAITDRNPGKFLYNARTGFAAVSPVQHPGAQGNNWWDAALRDVPDMLQRHWRGAR